MREKTWILIILGITAIVIIIFAAVMFEMRKKNKGAFNPDTHKGFVPPDSAVYYPTGDVTKLTKEEQEKRRKAIMDYLAANPS